MRSASDSGIEPDRLAAMRSSLALRSAALQAVRRFFTARGFIEVETPVRIPAPALELNIDAEPAADWYLRTSPELHMKRLLAAGYPRIFQMGACFRRGERGARHHPEYTMLEWYRAGASYLDVLEDGEGLVAAVARETRGGMAIETHRGSVDLTPPWARLDVCEAYRRFAGWDPGEAFDPDRFDHDMVERVEPNLPADRPVVLIDYPAGAGGFARPKAGRTGVTERWELYVAGVELANAFGELTDPAEQRRRFEACARERQSAGRAVYPLDEPFLRALERGMPESGGVALGFDRLVMLLAGADSLDAVLPFREA